MRNNTIKYLIDTYGDKIYAMFFKNKVIAFIGYDHHTKLSDISLDAITSSPDDEVVKIKQTQNYNGTELHFTVYHASSKLEYVCVMDDDSAQYRPDPIYIK